LGISGTGGGFKKFCRGETDISNASRPILKKEIDACRETGIKYIELPVAYDGIAVVVNAKNENVMAMTTADLKKIWEPIAEKEVNRWNHVKRMWPETPLKLYAPGVIVQAPSITLQKPLSESPGRVEMILPQVWIIMHLSKGLQPIKIPWGFWDTPIMQKIERS
jgi:hypothetical protein